MASKTATKQSKRINSTLKRPIFKSAQERYNERAVPLERIQNRLCYECGEIVSAAAYGLHQLHHESVYLAYQLYYAEGPLELASNSHDNSFESTRTCETSGGLLDTPVEPNSTSPPEIFVDVTSLDDEEVPPEDNQNSTGNSSGTLSIGNNFDLPGLSDENGKDLTQTEINPRAASVKGFEMPKTDLRQSDETGKELTQTEIDPRPASIEDFEKPVPKTDLKQNEVVSMSQESLDELDRRYILANLGSNSAIVRLPQIDRTLKRLRRTNRISV